MTFTKNLRAAGGAALLSLVLISGAASELIAQDQPVAPPPEQTFTADQLDDLVAPVALYPDPLLSQVLVAATNPLQVVQAYQWMQRNPGLAGPALTQAAEQQDWDGSVQALAMFPDVLKLLNDDVSWTTALGNAFLGQQQDVMDAVQRMRLKAQNAGMLQPSPQENVVSDAGAIEIVPVDPNVIYVPVYDPAWIWGPAVYYPYPQWVWPSRAILRGGLFFGFAPGINVGLFFGAGWHGWAGWGWHPGWGNRTVVVNDTFVRQYHFNPPRAMHAHGSTGWTGQPSPRNLALGQEHAPAPQAGPLGNRPTPPAVTPPAGRAFGGASQAPQAGPLGNRPTPPAVTPPVSRAFGGASQAPVARPQPMRPAPVPRVSPAPRPAPAPRGAPAPRAASPRGGRDR